MFLNAATKAPQVGDKMPDGTVYAGTSPNTGKPMYTTPKDAGLLMMSWEKATKYAVKLGAHGHNDWRVPTKSELNVLFLNRAAVGGFKTKVSLPSDTPDFIEDYFYNRTWYHASTEANYGNWGQDFRTGRQDVHLPRASLRCVRG